ncbi:hypothetical protein B0T11DRAFT_353999 [Plectosphaerella cucumerina]|uniref:Uncharacterized protein n=1 Tax=Plectosphaerella cucumerina TaxID=40658 RepID=A0A8K0TLC6_9PEZI|nr:hypothetical protein B0T11DRAFT_353999 [Plectosphaerella cucumerina]
MQQVSDGLLLQPLLDSSSPAVGADHYDAWDWAGDRHDQPESFLPEAVPHGTLDHTQRQGLAKAAQTGAVGETVNISREVHYIRQDAQFEERINQRLANVVEQFDQKLLDTEERICRKLTDIEERIYAEMAQFKETLSQSETR